MYLLRHGETEWNVAGRMQGQLDSALTHQGQGQARAMGASLKIALKAAQKATLGSGQQIEIQASPLGRTWHTAEIVAAEIGYSAAGIIPVDALKEVDWGQWNGLSRAEINAQWPDVWAAREVDKWHTRPPAVRVMPIWRIGPGPGWPNIASGKI